MKKAIAKITMFLFVVSLFVGNNVLAATTDFTANGSITVSSVTFGSGTADMLILSGSTAETWTFSSGTFTVTNPGSAFKVGSSDSTVKSIRVTLSGSNVACAENTTAGTSYVTIPTTAGTYTVIPSTSTDCTSLCTTLANTATYNSFPTCGAATCNSGYSISGSGASAVCIGASVISVGGGGGGGASTPTTYQTYNPTTGELSTGAQSTAKTTTPTTNQSNSQSSSKVSATPGVPAKDAKGNITIEQIADDAQIIISGIATKIATAMGTAQDPSAERNFNSTVTERIVKGNSISQSVRATINNFVTYGTKSTKILGAGERGGAVNSFKEAFGKLPQTQADWNDIVKIANGRWPSQTSVSKEANASAQFKKIYLREPVRSNPHDDAAITVISYGLRPANRNLNSEKTAIKTFANIFKKDPATATDWDTVRAIAYSGAAR